jgi:hypothetical protein
MFQKMSGQSNKTKNSQGQKDTTLETLRDTGNSMVKNTANEFKKIGSGVFDQFFGSYDTDYNDGLESPLNWQKESKPTQKTKQEFKLFNYTEYYEKELVKRQIKELTEQIKKEIELIKKADASLLNEVRDVEKISLNSLPEKPGIYHIRFLEIVLNILRALRAKIGESKTWLQALVSKKKKRGSLFLARSKKQGTQYSLSQELQTARSIQ